MNIVAPNTVRARKRCNQLPIPCKVVFLLIHPQLISKVMDFSIKIRHLFAYVGAGPTEQTSAFSENAKLVLKVGYRIVVTEDPALYFSYRH